MYSEMKAIKHFREKRPESNCRLWCDHSYGVNIACNQMKHFCSIFNQSWLIKALRHGQREDCDKSILSNFPTASQLFKLDVNVRKTCNEVDVMQNSLKHHWLSLYFVCDLKSLLRIHHLRRPHGGFIVYCQRLYCRCGH